MEERPPDRRLSIGLTTSIDSKVTKSMSVKLTASDLISLYMLSVIHSLFLSWSQCLEDTSFDLSGSAHFSKTQAREVLNGQAVTYLSIRSLWVPIVSICTPHCLSVSVRSVGLPVCLSGLLFRYSLCNKIRLTLQGEACAGSICFLTASLILLLFRT